MRSYLACSATLLTLLMACGTRNPMNGARSTGGAMTAATATGGTTNPGGTGGSPSQSPDASAARLDSGNSSPGPLATLDGIWSGDVDLVAPGFYGPPVDHLVLSFANGKLRSSRFDKFGQTRTYGDAATEYPLEGHRMVQPGPFVGATQDVTVQESSWTSTAFRLCFHSYDAEGTVSTDFVECVSGTLESVGLRIQYSIKGSLGEAPVDAHASGILTNPSMGNVVRDTLAGSWAGDIEVKSGSQSEPERLVVRFSTDNRLAYFEFGDEIFGHSFGKEPGNYPLTGTAEVAPVDSTFSFVSEVRESSFSTTAFSFRYHVVNRDSTTASTDYVEGLSGTIQNGRLSIHWDFDGMLLVAAFTKTADGTLVAQP